MPKSKRTIKTVDDARQALIDLTPDGFMLLFHSHFSYQRENGHTFSSVSMNASVVSPRGGGNYPRVDATSPAQIVREFIAKILPQINPPAPREPPQSRAPAKPRPSLRRLEHSAESAPRLPAPAVVRRLTHQPIRDAGTLFDANHD